MFFLKMTIIFLVILVLMATADGLLGFSKLFDEKFEKFNITYDAVMFIVSSISIVNLAIFIIVKL